MESFQWGFLRKMYAVVYCHHDAVDTTLRASMDGAPAGRPGDAPDRLHPSRVSPPDWKAQRHDPAAAVTTPNFFETETDRAVQGAEAAARVFDRIDECEWVWKVRCNRDVRCTIENSFLSQPWIRRIFVAVGFILVVSLLGFSVVACQAQSRKSWSFKTASFCSEFGLPRDHVVGLCLSSDGLRDIATANVMEITCNRTRYSFGRPHEGSVMIFCL